MISMLSSGRISSLCRIETLEENITDTLRNALNNSINPKLLSSLNCFDKSPIKTKSKESWNKILKFDYESGGPRQKVPETRACFPNSPLRRENLEKQAHYNNLAENIVPIRGYEKNSSEFRLEIRQSILGCSFVQDDNKVTNCPIIIEKKLKDPNFEQSASVVPSTDIRIRLDQNDDDVAKLRKVSSLPPSPRQKSELGDIPILNQTILKERLQVVVSNDCLVNHDSITDHQHSLKSLLVGSLQEPLTMTLAEFRTLEVPTHYPARSILIPQSRCRFSSASTQTSAERYKSSDKKVSFSNNMICYLYGQRD